MSERKGLTRRDLFSIFRRSAERAVEPMPQAPAVPPPPAPLRPPGAGPELVVADSCVRCGACVEICPRQAIRPLPDLYGAWAGTPHIIARQAPCVVCHGLLCTTVCPSGTLRPLSQPAEIQMGLAIVDEARCLPFNGQPCGECHRRCPVPGAITLDEQGRPAVHDPCIGCGLCEYYCPTTPPSIKVRPREADFWS